MSMVTAGRRRVAMIYVSGWSVGMGAGGSLGGMGMAVGTAYRSRGYGTWRSPYEALSKVRRNTAAVTQVPVGRNSGPCSRPKCNQPG